MPETSAEVAQIWERLGDCLRLAGELDEATRAYGLRAGSGRRSASSRSRSSARKASFVAMRQLLERDPLVRPWVQGRGSPSRRGGADQGADRARVVFAGSAFPPGEFRDCIRRCRAIVEEALPIADMKSLANAYLYLHVAMLGSSERVQFRGLAPLFEELGDLRGQATALNNLGIEAYYEGDWDKALDVYDRSRALFERIGDVISVAMANNNIGEIRSDQGARGSPDAVRGGRARVRRRRPSGALQRRPLEPGRVAARAGRVDEAEALLQEALAAFRGIHATSFVLETEARLAEVSALRGDRPQEALNAESVLEHTEDAADMPSSMRPHLRLRAAARLQLGDRAGAEQDLEESLRAARAGDSLYELALALDLSAAFLETTTRRARARRCSSSLPSRTWRDRRCLWDELLRPAVGAGAVTSTQISSARRRTGLRERAGRRLRGDSRNSTRRRAPPGWGRRPAGLQT